MLSNMVALHRCIDGPTRTVVTEKPRGAGGTRIANGVPMCFQDISRDTLKMSRIDVRSHMPRKNVFAIDNDMFYYNDRY